MITRDISEEPVRSAAEYPGVTILGPRQSGKTTLARMTFPDKPYFSLEDPEVRIFNPLQLTQVKILLCLP